MIEFDRSQKHVRSNPEQRATAKLLADTNSHWQAISNQNQEKPAEQTNELKTLLNELGSNVPATRQAASQKLDKFLETNFVPGNKSLIEMINFSEEQKDKKVEAASSIRDALNTAWGNIKPEERVKFLGDKEPVIKYWAAEKVYRSETGIADMLELAPIIEKNGNKDSQAMLKRVANQHGYVMQGELFQKKVAQWNEIIGSIKQYTGGDFSEIDQKDRDKVIKKLTAETTDFIKNIDEASISERGVLARVLHPLESRKVNTTIGSEIWAAAPGKGRFDVADIFVKTAEKLKAHYKNPTAITDLQTKAIQYVKEGITKAPEYKDTKFMQDLIKQLRELNPTNYDKLVPSKLPWAEK